MSDGEEVAVSKVLRPELVITPNFLRDRGFPFAESEAERPSMSGCTCRTYAANAAAYGLEDTVMIPATVSTFWTRCRHTYAMDFKNLSRWRKEVV